jgi:hypothetical protein
MCPRTTLASQRPCSGMGWCMRCLSWSLTRLSCARIRFEIVIRFTQNRPFPVVAQMCVKPRKSNVSGLPLPRRAWFEAANRPNSISRVLSGCSSSPNFANRSRSPARNLSASSRYSNPTMKSSAQRTMITSPRACRFLHQSAHRSKT